MMIFNLIKDINQISGVHFSALFLDDKIYYKNDNSNEYFTTKVDTYIELKQQYDNVYIVTNNYSYYLKFKNEYNVLFIPYFIHKHVVIHNNLFTGNIIDDSLVSIVDLFSLLSYMSLDKDKVFQYADDIILNETYRKIIVSDENINLVSYNKLNYDEFNNYLSDNANTKMFDGKYRNVTKYNYILDLPLSSDYINEFTSMSYYPFIYKLYYDEPLLFIHNDFYIDNIDMYNLLVDNGYLSYIELDGKFHTYKINDIPYKDLIMYVDIFNNKTLKLEF